MLPVTVEFIVAMIAHAIIERMAWRLDYLQEENRVLKEALRAATGKRRIPCDGSATAARCLRS